MSDTLPPPSLAAWRDFSRISLYKINRDIHSGIIFLINRGEAIPPVMPDTTYVPDFQCLTVERLCDSVTGNWPAVLLVSPVEKNMTMHFYYYGCS